VRERRRSEQIGRARSDGRGDRHHAAAKMRLRVRNRAVCHCLLVMRAQRRQRVAMLIQRLAHACHVAMTEDCEHAAKERLGAEAVFCRDALRGQIAHERLCGGQAQRAARTRAAC